jgi:hypothetical protein
VLKLRSGWHSFLWSSPFRCCSQIKLISIHLKL